MSTKGSNAEIAINPAGEEDGAHVMPSMELYVQGHNCTHLVALGKIYDGGGLPYTTWLMQMMWLGSVLKKFMTMTLKFRS